MKPPVLGVMPQASHTRIWGIFRCSSLQILSSFVSGVFRSLQSYLSWFKSGLWLGHLRTFRFVPKPQCCFHQTRDSCFCRCFQVPSVGFHPTSGPYEARVGGVLRWLSAHGIPFPPNCSDVQLWEESRLFHNFFLSELAELLRRFFWCYGLMKSIGILTL